MFVTHRRILVVEDDALIAMLLEDMLSELDYAVAGTAADLEDALEMAKGGAFDAAILDVSLAGKSSLPVARLLDEKNKPYIFATGYGVLPEGMEGSGRQLLNKPYQLHQLEAALTSLNIG
ncbi:MULTISPECIES: response regulator [unclassified Rhizobium]|uniref:response regulator n=2 Tax=unclassified Rhizobium TaxID=2613769 RepID=UPI001ADBFAF3|nr:MULTISPECIES: response regulator [unclassified Rhizobium]MBO9098039.1 response regulator [Rhizobium sp. L58/93]MBO9168190.1 response regulator [Rhizobium sp. L245/93]MBO9184235.1 response regulator [Rhizobium sp. E27B/91]QXZ85744.1 response regulator [Rhizobium sp. K1/93]QXZ97815.1 response regulator [Rhizobium sp. B230/85]QYA03419.1 response regulator [Rhizobium sp. B21/90]